jgi:murein tripeptide amidase MpaA
MILKIVFQLSFLFCFTNALVSFEYHNYDSLTQILRGFAQRFPSKAYLYSLGKTVQYRDIWVMAISDSLPDRHVPLRPEAKYIAGMHGNEPNCKEVLLQLIDYLLSNQTSDSNVDNLLKNTRVHILPSVNPDGFEIATVGDCTGKKGRFNANNVDLNRNFPDLFAENNVTTQPETQALLNWFSNNHFVLSADFHSGAVVINYPYDNYFNATEAKYASTQEDSLFRKLATTYSYNHASMRSTQCPNETFSGGITNGGLSFGVLLYFN